MAWSRLDSQVMNETSMWGVLLTVLAAMTSAIATLWKVNESKNSKAIEELKKDIKDCQDDRDMLREKLEETKESLIDFKIKLGHPG